MMQKEIMIRFSDLLKDIPYRIIIKNIEENNIYRYNFLKFHALIPFGKEARECTIIFPKYKFRQAYVALSVSTRRSVGKTNVFIEFYKGDNSKLTIKRLEKWKKI